MYELIDGTVCISPNSEVDSVNGNFITLRLGKHRHSIIIYNVEYRPAEPDTDIGEGFEFNGAASSLGYPVELPPEVQERISDALLEEREHHRIESEEHHNDD